MASKVGQKRDGRTKEPEYWSWVRLRRRCLQPTHKSYKDYGGRGIAVCPEWRDDYPAFVAYIGRKPSPKHTVERINNNGNYEPGNVCWALQKEQTRNRRGLHQITYRGETRCRSEWAERLGVPKWKLKIRVARMPLEDAMNTEIPLPAKRRA